MTEEVEEHEREAIGSRPDLDRHKLPCVLVDALIHLDEGVGDIFQKVVAGVTKPTCLLQLKHSCFASWSGR